MKPAAVRYDRTILVKIPPGVPGTRATLFWMDRLVRKGIGDPAVAELAEFFQTRFGGRPHDERSQIEAIRRGLMAGMFFIKDARRRETLRDPRKLVRKMIAFFRGEGPRPLGDCDDFTIAGRTLAEFIGLLTKSRAIGSIKPGYYNHVYAMVKLSRGGWVPLDPTLKKGRPFYAPKSTVIAPLDGPNLAGPDETPRRRRWLVPVAGILVAAAFALRRRCAS